MGVNVRSLLLRRRLLPIKRVTIQTRLEFLLPNRLCHVYAPLRLCDGNRALILSFSSLPRLSVPNVLQARMVAGKTLNTRRKVSFSDGRTLPVVLHHGQGCLSVLSNQPPSFPSPLQGRQASMIATMLVLRCHHKGDFRMGGLKRNRTAHFPSRMSTTLSPDNFEPVNIGGDDWTRTSNPSVD
ncbi:hypothetical protein UFOVP1290_150 [uncultured Caudovirales phage]|uniref:Uncharacterized protein n=1 Tax=uncultured Caudovirales phage TaxID=2100421 RepID=A0A6J5RGF0_9CAUD|nr:hypothetical protein UFOVP1290_150 [uncultured Caudovirales phage]